MENVRRWPPFHEVVYCSRGGNTKRVAEAIAEELGVVPESAKARSESNRDSFIFLDPDVTAASLATSLWSLLREMISGAER